MREMAVDRTAKEMKQTKASKTVPVSKRKASEDVAPMATKKSKSLKSILKTATSDRVQTPLKASSQPRSKTSRATIASFTSSAKSEKGFKQQPKPKASLRITETSAQSGPFDSDQNSVSDDLTETILKESNSGIKEEVEGIKKGLVPGEYLPKAPALSQKHQTRMKRIGQSGEAEKPGVIYIGRIPHGFYEQEMRAYFEQFGKILQLRLSRNRKTGGSKHRAWVKFESATVAEIVAKTMDNYLLFNHILKVKIVPDQQIPENLFKGANKRFKKVPWNKIAGRKLKEATTENVWQRRVLKEQRRREEKAEKLKQLGYEFKAPSLRSAVGLARKVEQPSQITLGDGGDGVESSKENVNGD